MLIGKLHPNDQDLIDEQMENVTEQTPDPYENEPERNASLIVHGDTPMNAEVPQEVITEKYLTPNELFYIRHHHPVPYLSEGELEDFRLEVDLTLMFPDALKKRKAAEGDDDDDDEEVALPATTAVDIVRRETTDTTTSTSCSNSVVAKLSLDQIKALPKVELISTLQCSGNRRGGFNGLRQTSGTPWGQGAISTARWGGARLIDVLMLAMEEVSKDQASDEKKKNASDGKDYKQSSLIETLHRLQTLIDDHPELQHLRFESLDGMLASIDANKGLNPFGDVIVAYEMNGEDLPRDHGYPLRVIVPGYAAVRNVKWLKKLELAEEEAEGTWQRGLNYKILPPTVLDAKEVDLNIMPGLSEECVFSGITKVENLSHTTPTVSTTTTALEEEIFGSMLSMAPSFQPARTPLTPGETVLVKTSGWAYAGGGRNIVRVDVTGNNGKSWQTATITEGSNQPLRRAWAWVFWECEVPAIVCEDGVSVELACKGVDMAFNTQPESMGGMWNVRGLVNNSYYRVKHVVE
jgi:sulfite oxidase